MSDIKSLIDFFINAIYNFYNTFLSQAPLWFGVMVTSVFLFPLFTRIVRSLRSSTK